MPRRSGLFPFGNAGFCEAESRSKPEPQGPRFSVCEAYSKCETEAKLTPAQKKQLEQAKKACYRKFARVQGSIAVSESAYCVLEAVMKYVK